MAVICVADYVYQVKGNEKQSPTSHLPALMQFIRPGSTDLKSCDLDEQIPLNQAVWDSHNDATYVSATPDAGRQRAFIEEDVEV